MFIGLALIKELSPAHPLGKSLLKDAFAVMMGELPN
jgi:hypothetical protein